MSLQLNNPDQGLSTASECDSHSQSLCSWGAKLRTKLQFSWFRIHHVFCSHL